MVNTGRVFVQRYNPRTGKIETIAVDENYDYSQQIAHSAYNDMLHDKERVIKCLICTVDVID